MRKIHLSGRRQTSCWEHNLEDNDTQKWLANHQAHHEGIGEDNKLIKRGLENNILHKFDSVDRHDFVQRVKKQQGKTPAPSVL